jgi:hypothetical protein
MSPSLCTCAVHEWAHFPLRLKLIHDKLSSCSPTWGSWSYQDMREWEWIDNRASWWPRCYYFMKTIFQATVEMKHLKYGVLSLHSSCLQLLCLRLWVIDSLKLSW